MNVAAAVITVSDRSYRKERDDESGDTLQRLLEAFGAGRVERLLVPDRKKAIAGALTELCDAGEICLILTTGGTGLDPGDVTPEATIEVIDRSAPGFAEAIRAAGVNHTPRAMLSRAVSGVRGRTLIINLPGSPAACRQSFAVIKPVLGHALEVLGGSGH